RRRHRPAERAAILGALGAAPRRGCRRDRRVMTVSLLAPPIRVLVVDDSGFMRIALRKIIEADGDIRVVGEARNGREAIRLAQELKPDVVTMDIVMPEMDGIEATRRIV